MGIIDYFCFASSHAGFLTSQDFSLSVSITHGGLSEVEMGRKDALVSRLFLDFHMFSLLLQLGTPCRPKMWLFDVLSLNNQLSLWCVQEQLGQNPTVSTLKLASVSFVSFSPGLPPVSALLLVYELFSKSRYFPMCQL